MQQVSLYQFNKLSRRQQYGLLEEFGTDLDVSRSDDSYQINLFEINGYYVEMWLNKNKGQVVKAVAFTSYKKLDPYIKDIDITAVYSAL